MISEQQCLFLHIYPLVLQFSKNTYANFLQPCPYETGKTYDSEKKPQRNKVNHFSNISACLHYHKQLQYFSLCIYAKINTYSKNIYHHNPSQKQFIF